ncbi:hypothetical protein MRX96_009707 [Rhipicephalus microplus]
MLLPRPSPSWLEFWLPVLDGEEAVARMLCIHGHTPAHRQQWCVSLWWLRKLLRQQHVTSELHLRLAIVRRQRSLQRHSHTDPERLQSELQGIELWIRL